MVSKRFGQVSGIMTVILLFSSQMAVAQAVESALRPGDMVRVTVWQKPELSGDIEIGPDSTLVHPQYRNIKVVGVPFAEVDARIRQSLSRWVQNPEFVVTPLLRIPVVGEVLTPAIHSLPSGMTIAQAVAAAGGVSDEGNQEKVYLFRDGHRQTVNLTDPSMGLAATRIRSGDQIVVTRQVSVLRDIIGPIASVTAAVTAVLNLVLR